MVLICPYCEIEISEKLVEAEDGCCPECGTLLTVNPIVDDDNGDMYEEDEYANEFAEEDFPDDDEEEYADIDFDEPKEPKKEPKKGNK